MNISSSINSITNTYSKLPIIGKLLILITIFLIVIVMLKGFKSQILLEGYEQNDKFLFKQGPIFMTIFMPIFMII